MAISFLTVICIFNVFLILCSYRLRKSMVSIHSQGFKTNLHDFHANILTHKVIVYFMKDIFLYSNCKTRPFYLCCIYFFLS